jgi:hypothetical protein
MATATLPMVDKDLIFEWDACQLIQDEAKILFEDRNQAIADGRIQEDEAKTEDECFDLISEDPDFLRWHWEDMCEVMSERLGDTTDWFAIVENFGWRALNGHKFFSIPERDFSKMLGEVLPKCDCTFKIFKEGKKGIRIQNWHHDSCTGQEMYYIYPDTPYYRKKYLPEKDN